MVSDMLAAWVAPLTLPTFLQVHFQKQPYAAPGTAQDALALLTWETLQNVLGSSLPLDLVTVAAGRIVEAPVPRDLADVRRLMSAGVSVVIRASERHDPGLAALASDFAQILPGDVHIQIYATPAGTNSYGWHYDFEDVFIAQTAGVKDYYFRDNTVARDTVLGGELDFAVFRQERSPLLSSKLLPGDWLYVPTRWWHLVKCVEDSLSISIGVMPPEAFRTAKRVPAGWSAPQR